MSEEWEPGDASLERRVKHRGQGEEETLIPASRLLTCPSGPSSTARRASSGAQRNRPQRLWVSDVLCRVSSVCSPVRVSGGPKNRELVIIILRVSRGRRIGSDLESFGKVVASGLCACTRGECLHWPGAGAAAEATCEGLSHETGAGCRQQYPQISGGPIPGQCHVVSWPGDLPDKSPETGFSPSRTPLGSSPRSRGRPHLVQRAGGSSSLCGSGSRLNQPSQNFAQQKSLAASALRGSWALGGGTQCLYVFSMSLFAMVPEEQG